MNPRADTAETMRDAALKRDMVHKAWKMRRGRGWI